MGLARLCAEHGRTADSCRGAELGETPRRLEMGEKSPRLLAAEHGPGAGSELSVKSSGLVNIQWHFTTGRRLLVE